MIHSGPRIVFTMACALSGASPALGQDPVVTTVWSFTEVYAGTNTPVANPNGILEPGEAARIELTISFSPPVGTALAQGSVAGFQSLRCDLIGFGDAGGAWSHFERPPLWALGHAGFPDPGGEAVREIGVGQFPWPPGTLVDPQNPIPMIWSAVWVPDSYLPREVVFNSTITSPPPTVSSSALFVLTGAVPEPQYSVVAAYTVFGTVHIPIIPAPGSVIILGIGAAAALRRRR
jgi:hypothetical protein